MKKIILLVAWAALTLGGWSYAQKQELLTHAQDIEMQKLQNASCSPSSSPGGQ